MTLGKWFEANLSRVLKARARAVAASGMAGKPATGAASGAVADTIALCLAALRPRNRWPENTRFYAAIRSRLAEDPVRVAAAFGAVAAVGIYFGFGRTGLFWLGAVLRGPG